LRFIRLGIVSETDKIEFSKVELKREWGFWESYSTKDGNTQNDYSNLLKNIYSFNNIISFWQFWNNYPGSDISNIFFDGEKLKFFFEEKYRIVGLNLFEKNTKPDYDIEPLKDNCVIYTLEFSLASQHQNSDKIKDINSLSYAISREWIKLICMLIGETMDNSENIWGIRLTDKTKVEKKVEKKGDSNNPKKFKVMFRFEIWTNKNLAPSINKEKSDHFKQYLSEFYGSAATVKEYIGK